MNIRYLPVVLVFCVLNFLFTLSSRTAWAQQHGISGTVTNEAGAPLFDVTVQVKGSPNGTTTDQNGHYAIQAGPADTLVFSYIGFKTQAVRVGDNTRINVELSSGKKSLNELVVIGYGNQERKDVTGAVSTVHAAAIKNIPAASFDLKLQGQVAGVSV